MRLPPLFAVAATIVLVSCRDVGEPFRPIDREGAAGVDVRRLTFSASDDRAPAWSSDGDTVYYTTSSWEENPLAPGTIVAIPADGSGPARALLPRAQVGNQARSWLTAVAPGPDDTVAFVRVLPLLPEQPCGVVRCDIDTIRPMVQLTAGEVHVRAHGAIGPISDDIILPLAFSGYSVVVDTAELGDVLTISDYHPFQLEFERVHRSFFRPSWSPDGTRIAISDGLHVFVWNLASGTLDQVTGSQDGFMAAWSPDGAWIAFAQYPRVASEVIRCDYEYNNSPACAERRIIHHHRRPRVVLVKSDNSDRIDLSVMTGTTGTDPAWSPDAGFVYVSTTQPGYTVIARIDVEELTVDLIEGTEGGIEPAVSPDGRRVAFARPGDAGHDIWVADLQ